MICVRGPDGLLHRVWIDVGEWQRRKREEEWKNLAEQYARAGRKGPGDL